MKNLNNQSLNIIDSLLNIVDSSLNTVDSPSILLLLILQAIIHKHLRLLPYLHRHRQETSTEGTSERISLPFDQWSTFKNIVPATEEAITKFEGRI
ncbi:hypothetical protein RYX36_010431, partial [Vicia faba]